jgi:4-hydroxybenzoate polyprenyltransferase
VHKLQFNNIIAFLRLIRFQNLLIVVGTLYLVRYCILSPILKYGELSLQLNEFSFFLLVLSTVFITSAGYVINDYFDRKTDLVNKPHSVIIGKKINRRYAMAFHIVFNIIGILIGFYISLSIGEPFLSLIFITVSGLLWFYSTTYKKQLLVGNLIVAFLTALVPLIVFLFEYPLLKSTYSNLFTTYSSIIKYLTSWILGYAGFAFLLTLAREIIKDTEDFEGDSAYGNQTIPIVVGTPYTKGIIVVLFVFAIIAVFYVYFTYLTNKFTLYFILIALVIPLIYNIYRVIRAQNKKDYYISSLLTKIIMINGLLYALVANSIIPRYF